MIRRIFLITPDSSQYGALHHFTIKLCEAWIRAGYEAQYFHHAEDALQASLQSPPDLTIGFNGIPKKHEKYFGEIIRRPFLSILVDPFFRFFDITSNPYTIVGCDDLSGVVSLKNLHMNNVLFVPHAVESDLAPDPSLERIYDVCMLATFIDYEARRKEWISVYPEWICKIMDEAVERTFSEPLLPFTDAILSQLQAAYREKPELKSEMAKIDTLAIFRDVEIYIKGKERVELLQAIQTSPVHVFGNTADNVDWKGYFENQKNIIVHSGVSYEDSLRIMKQSKIILNSSIKNKFGAHERIFAGLAAGALPITHENAYLQQFFTNEIDISFYPYKKLDQINRIIHSYLSDEEKRLQVVENGRDLVMNYHTWDARIKGFEKELFPLAEKILTDKNLIDSSFES